MTPNDPQDDQPEESQNQPADDLDARITRHVNDLVESRVMPAIDRIAQQQRDDMQELFRRIPNEEQVVARVVETLESKVQGQEQKLAQETPTPTNGDTWWGNTPKGSPGSPSDDQPYTDQELLEQVHEQLESVKAAGGPAPSGGFGIKDLAGIAQALLPMMDYGLNSVFKLKMMQRQMQDPATLLKQWYQNSPEQTAFLISSWANQLNPMSQQIPHLMATSYMEGLKARGIGIKNFLGSGVPGSTPQNPLVLPSPTNPSASGGWPGTSANSSPQPNASSPAPQNGNSSGISLSQNGSAESPPNGNHDSSNASFIKMAVRK